MNNKHRTAYYVPTLSRFADSRCDVIGCDVIGYYETVCDEITSVLDYDTFLDREFLVGRTDTLTKPWVQEGVFETKKMEVMNDTNVQEPIFQEPIALDKNIQETSTQEPVSHKEPPLRKSSSSYLDPVDDLVHRFLSLVSPTYSLLRGIDKKETFLREFRNHLALCIETDVKHLPHVEGRLYPRFTRRVQAALWRVMDKKAVERYRARLVRNVVSEIDRVPDMNTIEDAAAVGEYLCHRFHVSICYEKRLLFHYPSRYVVDIDKEQLTAADVYKRNLCETYAKLNAENESVATLREIALTLGLRVKNGKKSDYVAAIQQYVRA